MKRITTEHLPIHMWIEGIEEGAMEQARNLANLPVAFHHVAIMPDAHQGYSMPIGGVLATQDVIIPNAVGVDIGCGMCVARTSTTQEELGVEKVKQVLGEIRRLVPVGMKHHDEKQEEVRLPVQFGVGVVYAPILTRERQASLYQLGTLGGGNHFIELQHDPQGRVWVMIHSGSRNVGKQVADYYNREAVRLNEVWKSVGNREWDLAFLPLDFQEGQQYLVEMQGCVEFAAASRRLMMERVGEALGCVGAGVEGATFVDVAHNYAALEHHFGKNVWVHRKGATLAREGVMGIIPGSQGSKSYIVRGKGNRDSFTSCSHGAGRKLSRAKARATLDLAAEVARLEAAGVVHGMRNQKDLDEAAGAYKDIEDVMVQQQELVEVVTELRPMGVVKG